MILSKEWFNECFDGSNVPTDIRRVSERICSAYGIAGLCDPMYIANVIAKETGRGDGSGKFVNQSSWYIDTSAHNARMIDDKPWFPDPTRDGYYITFEHMTQTPDGWFYTNTI